MRIAVNGMFWGMGATGSGKYVQQLLSALVTVAPAAQFTLFTPHVAATVPTPQGREHWIVCPLDTPFDRRHANLAKLWFEQVSFPRACQDACDLAHVPYFAPPRSASVPTIVTIHDLIPLLLPDYRGSRWVRLYMRLVSEAARRASYILTDSCASARDIERLLAIPSERIRVIYLAADAIYHPLSLCAQQPVLERLHIPRPYLLYLGGFDPRKNVSGLLHAFATVRRALPGMNLVVAGRLPERSDALARDPRSLIRQLGLTDAVYLAGWVEEEDSPALYAGAAAFVFPSYYEGFGLPVLEAISCGTPAIVGAGSSLEEVGGPGCVAVSPEDTAALSEAMVRLCEDADWRNGLAQAGLRHVQCFSWVETARQTWDAYQAAIEGA
jgi:glycosyltransferase involved in cell wall biosynthesis